MDPNKFVPDSGYLDKKTKVVKRAINVDLERSELHGGKASVEIRDRDSGITTSQLMDIGDGKKKD